MVEENISKEFRLRKIEKTKNCFVEEIQQNELMRKKHKKICTTLSYIEHFLILASVIIRWTSISAFASLLGIGVTISATELKICAITAGIKKYK